MTPRLVLLLLCAVASSGCLGATTASTTVLQSDRMALATAPAPPGAMSGGSGVALGMRLLPFAPESASGRGAVSYAVVQPELGGVVRFHQGTSLMGRISGSSSDGALLPEGGKTKVSGEALAFDFVVGVAHDLAFHERWGLVASAEFGANTVPSMTRTSRSERRETTVLPTLRLGVGPYLNLGPVRLYAGFSGGSVATNDFTSTVIETCTSFTGCNSVDRGFVDFGFIGMVGGGARYQFHSVASLGLDVWVPVGSEGSRPPLVAGLSLRLGDFNVPRPKPKPAHAPVTAPPPPEWEEPAELPAPTPL